ncbi:MAG TPA: hydrogenase maturation nickel metallochaperone HypA [Ktedonobacteraceae bacterium]|jgi:hydrogenase nickel incorporation protein HypA/HybF|nr:hydrogenase maturation nickel metallochaperone HypA [Ktedonobacteraceae bacterium]
MHELSIAQSLFEAVQIQAHEHKASRVNSVRLRVGEASGVVTDSLLFCFEMLISLDPVLEDAQLLIDRIPHRAWCAICAQEFPILYGIPQCPTCTEWSGNILSGTELQLLEMEFEANDEISQAQEA